MIDFTVTPELLARGAETPFINHSPLPRYAMDELDYGMTIGVAATRGGRLYVCWVGGADGPEAFFLLARSVDSGVTWSEPLLVIDPHDESLPCDRCTLVGTLWVDPLNRLWLFFNQTLQHYDGRSTNWYIRCDDPDAETPVWTQPRYVYHGCTLNKPTILSSGEWMLPVSVWSRCYIASRFADCYHDLDYLRMANVLVSSDQGDTWTWRGGAYFPDSAFDEHMIIELRDKRLWMMGRVKSGLMESFSDDGGATWSEAVRARAQSVSARFCLRRLRSGRVLLIKHGIDVSKSAPNRSEMAAFLSDDDGETWSNGFLIDERYEISYPDADQTDDGTIVITYDRNRARDGEIIMAALKEEDILSGGLISRGSFVKRVILRPGKLAEAPDRRP